MENFVLSVGDTPNKNIPFARDVLNLLRTRFVHLNWVIVGNRELVMKQLALPGNMLPEWITVLENPTDGILKACYQKALALLFPSTHEGFGIPAMEAMRLGCPVLAFDIEPMKSLIIHTPSLLPVNDPEAWRAALTRFLHDPEFRKEAIDAGIRQSLEFTWDNAAKALLKLYRN
jgi:glycosyltransferase involved in cell wall biosynthesis